MEGGVFLVQSGFHCHLWTWTWVAAFHINSMINYSMRVFSLGLMFLLSSRCQRSSLDRAHLSVSVLCTSGVAVCVCVSSWVYSVTDRHCHLCCSGDIVYCISSGRHDGITYYVVVVDVAV